MSANLDFRTLIGALLPEGPIWRPDPTGYFEKLLQGIANFWEGVYDDMELISHVRDPYKTDALADLERDYGVIPNSALTETVRRQHLASLVYARPDTASWEHVQDALRAAGFDNLYVTPNDPAINPDEIGGDLLVNGPIYSYQEPAYYMCCDSDIAFCDNSKAVCDYYLTMSRTEKTYIVPDVYSIYHNCFWVGGEASGWPDSPTVPEVEVDADRETQLKNLILKHKPVHTWALLRISFV